MRELFSRQFVTSRDFLVKHDRPSNSAEFIARSVRNTCAASKVCPFEEFAETNGYIFNRKRSLAKMPCLNNSERTAENRNNSVGAGYEITGRVFPEYFRTNSFVITHIVVNVIPVREIRASRNLRDVKNALFRRDAPPTCTIANRVEH